MSTGLVMGLALTGTGTLMGLFLTSCWMLRFPQFVQNRSEEYIRDATRAAIIMGAVYGVLFVLMLGKCWLNWRNTQMMGSPKPISLQELAVESKRARHEDDGSSEEETKKLA